MTKKETIKNIKDLNSLASIVTRFCERTSLSDITRINETVVSATESGAFKTVTNKFILTLSELHGKVPQIADLVKQNTSRDDQVFILTTNPKKISSYFQDFLEKETKQHNFTYWNQDDLISIIDKHLPDYWGHSDLFLKGYENNFLSEMQKEAELKKILKLDKKFDDLLGFFIEPKIFIFKDDSQSQKKIKVKIQIEHLIKKENYFISGEAGTGKSTLLQHIGKLLIESNEKKEKKTVPVFIKASDIQSAEYSIEGAIDAVLLRTFAQADLDKVYEEYQMCILVDSIDEFEKDIQTKLLDELKNMVEGEGVNFILCTRNYDSLSKENELCNHTQAQITNFDQRQIKAYLDNFFKFDLTKSDKLWENINENRILERIPITPLTISLVSILYEERQYEIPATLTDVYDNFNLFLLGRLTVKSRFEFLDITVKERILSTYALDIIKSENRVRKNKQEFLEFVKQFFSAKSITINDDLVPELLKNLIDGTGILYVDENGMVTFKHDHFMEYYASREIFNSQIRSELEQEIIKNFTQYNWQNTAIFYAGRTKDMPIFLKNLINQFDNYHNLNEILLAISGMGYILQSLWMTDSVVRRDGVLKAVDLLLKADAKVKDLSSEKAHFFVGIRELDIAMLNVFWFFEHYNSVVIRDPLNLAFDELTNRVAHIKSTKFENDKLSLWYQMFCIAATLDTGRNADPTNLTKLLNEPDILNNPLLLALFDLGMDLLENVNAAKLKESAKLESRSRRYKDGIRFYIDNNAEALRYTTHDQLVLLKNVELFTEGKSDAQIITKAFNALTGGAEPYWNVTSMDAIKSSGGANQLKKHIEELARNINSEYDKNKIVIGILDNDAKGNQEFGGLDGAFLTINPILKKHKDLLIYALLLPIPDGEYFKSYIPKKQEFKFFEIEHYFPESFLRQHNMVKETPLQGVLEITDKKTDFAEIVKQLSEPDMFNHFPVLFREIDQLCNKEINYME